MLKQKRGLFGVIALISSVVIVLSIFIGTADTTQAANNFNNEGISANTQTRNGNFDGQGASYSATALANAGFTSGSTINADGFSFQWPVVAAGTRDNWQASGQVVPVQSKGSVLALLGASANGSATGAAIIKYSDGTTQAFTLSLSDWTLGGGKLRMLASNRIVATLPYRNILGGGQNTSTYVFFTSVALQASRTIQSLMLPTTTTGGQMHVFAVSTNAINTTGLNNEGISLGNNLGSGDFDGQGASYSNDALTAAGFASGSNVKVKGATFQWPTVSGGRMDNWLADGQEIPVSGNGPVLGLLGASANGSASGTARMNFSDGTQQSFPLAFSDWTLLGGKAQPLANTSVAVSTPYRNMARGYRQNISTYIFYTGVNVPDGKTLKSVTLPTTTTPGQLHVFAAALGAAAPPAFNNEGISNDTNLANANFDGGGYSYSNQALMAAGFKPGSNVNVKGANFQWPAVGTGMNDNWQAAGQVIPVISGGSSLAFLGSAANGNQTGQATITYSDGTAQQATLAFSDWVLFAGKGQIVPGSGIAVALPYRNSVRNNGRNYLENYLFYAKIDLQSGKAIKSVTLPTNSNMHIFAITTQNFQEVAQTSSWPTYTFDNERSGDNTGETTLNAGNVGRLKMKWLARGNVGMSMQPVEANNAIYWGSWDGYMHATTTSGIQLWNTSIGQNYAQGCLPPTVAIGGTAVIGNVGTTSAVFVGGGGNTGGGDGQADYYALNATTGQVMWKTALGPAPQNFLWGSAALSNGSIYVGLASFGDCPLTQGKLFKLNANTGAIQSAYNIVPDGCLGGGIWGTPTISPDGTKLYVATGTYRSCNAPGNNSAGVIELNTATMSLMGAWHIPSEEVQGTDIEFGSAPTLMNFNYNGTNEHYVGISAKDGQFYIFYQDRISLGPIRHVFIADSGNCPQCDGGAIAPAVWDGSTVYVAGGHATINGVGCKGSVDAINPVNGGYKWRRCLTSGPVLGPLAGFPGAVIATQGSKFDALSMATGNVLFEYTDGSAGSMFYSGVSIASGQVYAPNLDGNFFDFGL
ncbi:MAG TPA: hypothetical protein VHZ51_10690 [Ktedonobacteraceae bacterium]|nr:hypothetical protein [Ktedonobacteraceae bacterium]